MSIDDKLKGRRSAADILFEAATMMKEMGFPAPELGEPLDEWAPKIYGFIEHYYLRWKEQQK